MRGGSGLVGLLSSTLGGMQLKAERSGGALCLVEWRSDRQHCGYRYVILTAALCGLMFNCGAVLVLKAGRANSARAKTACALLLKTSPYRAVNTPSQL